LSWQAGAAAGGGAGGNERHGRGSGSGAGPWAPSCPSPPLPTAALGASLTRAKATGAVRRPQASPTLPQGTGGSRTAELGALDTASRPAGRAAPLSAAAPARRAAEGRAGSRAVTAWGRPSPDRAAAQPPGVAPAASPASPFLRSFLTPGSWLCPAASGMPEAEETHGSGVHRPLALCVQRLPAPHKEPGGDRLPAERRLCQWTPRTLRGRPQRGVVGDGVPRPGEFPRIPALRCKAMAGINPGAQAAAERGGEGGRDGRGGREGGRAAAGGERAVARRRSV